MIKPIKIIFENQPSNHLIVVESESVPLGSMKYTQEKIKNILIQLGYLILRIIALNSKDSMIYKSLLSLSFNLYNLSVIDGRIKATAIDSLLFKPV